MADINSHIEIGVTTGPIRGSRKVHVGPYRVAMREIDLEPSSGEPPLRVYDTSGPYTDPAATIERLIAERSPTYALADIVVSSRDVPHEKIVEECVEALRAHLLGGATQTLM